MVMQPDNQSELDKELLDASTRGWSDVPAMRRALEQGANVNAINNEGRTALYNLAQYGENSPDGSEIEAVRLLLKYNADVRVLPPGSTRKLSEVAEWNGGPNMAKLIREAEERQTTPQEKDGGATGWRLRAKENNRATDNEVGG